jgi:RimJ/RimL family protein N-acetyltransferase
MNLPKLQSDRLILRALRVDDAEALHAAFSDEELMTWWSSGPHSTEAETLAYISQNCEPPYSPTWAITMSGGDDHAIGWIVLIESREGVREIGYILHRDHWGSGVGKEAASRILDHGFVDLKLRRIYADVDPDNLASAGLLKKLGFQQEGYMREEWETHIGVRDSLLFGLLASEWLSDPAADVDK